MSSTISSVAASQATEPGLTSRQLQQLQQELERELRWLTGTTALEWLSLPSESIADRCSGGARMHNRLTQVLEALDRIKTDTYGRCVGCKRSIPFARLEIVPETLTCVGCA
jgi:RNA polymerase-binding transcription factor DksA